MCHSNSARRQNHDTLMNFSKMDKSPRSRSLGSYNINFQYIYIYLDMNLLQEPKSTHAKSVYICFSHSCVFDE